MMLVNTNEDNLDNLELMLGSMEQSIAVLATAIPEMKKRLMVTRLAWTNGMQTHSQMITQMQANHVDLLQKQIIILRKIAIQLDIQNGIGGRDVALNYNVTQSRVSQVCSAPVSWQPVDQ
jgi:hypothetical protein